MQPLWYVLVGAVALVLLWWFARQRQGQYLKIAFAEFLAYLSEARPDLRARGIKEGFLVLSRGDDPPFVWRLGLLAERIQPGMPPEARRDVYAALVAEIDESIARARADLTAEQVRGRLYPRLITTAMRTEFDQREQPLVADELPELGLCVAYVIDYPRTVQYVSQSNMADLHLDPDELRSAAYENLRGTAIREAVRRVLTERTMASIKLLDSFDAARLLLVPEYLHDGEALAAVVPDRDTLVLLPDPEPHEWTDVHKLAVTEDPRRELLLRPVRVTRDGFELK